MANPVDGLVATAWPDAALAKLAELGRGALAGDPAATLAAAQFVLDRRGPPDRDAIEAWRKRLAAAHEAPAPE